VRDVRGKHYIVYSIRISAAESLVQGERNLMLYRAWHSELQVGLPSKVKADLNTSRANSSRQDKLEESSTATHESHRNAPAEQSPGELGAVSSLSLPTVRVASPSTHVREESRLLSPSNNLQPLSLLNARALEGEFSLDNILSTKETGQQDASKSSASLHGDPILGGLVSYHVGASLFHGYVEPCCNPQVRIVLTHPADL
jgi:hypothetical protein